MSKWLHSTDHLQIVLGMGIFPFYMTNLVLDNFNIISCTALIINCRLKFKWKPAGFYSDVWLKEQNMACKVLSSKNGRQWTVLASSQWVG